ncbi:hypothetical protein JXM67_02625 [candidate division WOR-3 bacterium]|nr:hypothetical protein [candidate division WOR-3 bacterium]
MAEQTLSYDGPKYDTSIWTSVKDAHIKLAIDWVGKVKYPQKYTHSNSSVRHPVIEFSSTCLKVLGSPIYCVPGNTYRNEIASSTFSASGYSKNDNPPPDYTPQSSSTTITVYKKLASLAWVRAGILHEKIENYIVIGYDQFTAPNRLDSRQVDAHDETCEIVRKYTFEDPGRERTIRINNLNRCKDDLNKIKWYAGAFSLAALGLVGAGISIAAIGSMLSAIENSKYIPGYCEAYVDYGYRNKDYSSIAFIFAPAEAAGIIPKPK